MIKKPSYILANNFSFTNNLKDLAIVDIIGEIDINLLDINIERSLLVLEKE